METLSTLLGPLCGESTDDRWIPLTKGPVIWNWWLLFMSVLNLRFTGEHWDGSEYARVGIYAFVTLEWRHNGHDGVSNHQPHDCLLNRLFRRRSKKTSKLRVTGLCAGKSPLTGEFPAQMASNAENVSIWWRHHHRGRSLLVLFSIARC